MPFQEDNAGGCHRAHGRDADVKNWKDRAGPGFLFSRAFLLRFLCLHLLFLSSVGVGLAWPLSFQCLDHSLFCFFSLVQVQPISFGYLGRNWPSDHP